VSDIDEIRTYLRYDPETGDFYWIKKPSRFANDKCIGAIAGAVSATGRRYIELRGKAYQAHRLAWAFAYGSWPEGLLDHKDGDPLNNRLDNLRAASSSQNAWNKRISRANTSGYKGVSWHATAQKWRARFWAHKKSISLGLFDTKEQAYTAYRQAIEKHHGEFARAA
jgi:hypothetical protein